VKADVEDYLGKNMDVVLFLGYIFPLCSFTAPAHMYCTYNLGLCSSIFVAVDSPLLGCPSGF
jgi:hypothetical protein